MARPTDFSDEILQQAADYLKDYEKHGHAIPSVVGLCEVINRSRSTVYQWAENQSQAFADILAQIVEKQEQVLISKGLTGDFNAAITKLVLGKHGYHDKQDTELTGKDGGALKTSIEVSFVGSKGPVS